MSDATVLGVVFDFDGVLVDSEPTHERVLRDTVREIGMDFDHAFFEESLVGTGDHAAFHVIARHNGRELDEDRVADLMRDKRERFAAAAQNGAVEPQVGAVELVLAISTRVPTAVCSGSRRAEVLPVLASLGLTEAVVGVVTADDVERPKPDPQPYADAARLIGVEPARCAAIEDTPTGLASALAAGMQTFGVCHTKSADELGRAHVIVDRIAELTGERVLAGV